MSFQRGPVAAGLQRRGYPAADSESWVIRAHTHCTIAGFGHSLGHHSLMFGPCRLKAHAKCGFNYFKAKPLARRASFGIVSCAATRWVYVHSSAVFSNACCSLRCHSHIFRYPKVFCGWLMQFVFVLPHLLSQPPTTRPLPHFPSHPGLTLLPHMPSHRPTTFPLPHTPSQPSLFLLPHLMSQPPMTLPLPHIPSQPRITPSSH